MCVLAEKTQTKQASKIIPPKIIIYPYLFLILQFNKTCLSLNHLLLLVHIYSDPCVIFIPKCQHFIKSLLQATQYLRKTNKVKPTIMHHTPIIVT